MSGASDITEYFEFWKRVADSGWFDVEHLMETKPSSCMIWLENNDDYPTQLFLYAKMGIHNYNMIHGTNLERSCLDKYVDIPKVFYRSAAGGGSLALFQTNVDEERCGMKKLYWDIARPKPEAQENPMQPLNNPAGPVDRSKGLRLPDEWPSENVFTDNNRYYVVKKSELVKYDWIRLYLKRAFLKANTKLKYVEDFFSFSPFIDSGSAGITITLFKLLVQPDLSKLVIVKEHVEMPNETLKSGNAIFYLRYKHHPNKGGVCKVHGFKPPRDRMAKNTGRYTLPMLGGPSAKA